MRGINTLIFHYHYSFDPEPAKFVCAIHSIPCSCPAYVAQLGKYRLPNFLPYYQPMYAHVEKCYY